MKRHVLLMLFVFCADASLRAQGQYRITLRSPAAGSAVEAGFEFVLAAEITHGDARVRGFPGWYASATLNGPEGHRQVILYDDGRARDQSAGDGIWTARIYAPTTAGEYALVVTCRLGQRLVRSDVSRFRVVAPSPVQRGPAAPTPAPPARQTLSWLVLLFAPVPGFLTTLAICWYVLRRKSDGRVATATLASRASGESDQARWAQAFQAVHTLNVTVDDVSSKMREAYETKVATDDRSASLASAVQALLDFADRLELSADNMLAIRERLRQLDAKYSRKG